MRTIPTIALAVAAAAALSGPATASAAPSDFPDLTGYQVVDPAPYYVAGAHPSLSGWTFRTPSGMRCQDNLIADIGVFCTAGPAVDGAPAQSVSVSLTQPAEVTQVAEGAPEGSYPLLPTGSAIAAGNGVRCAVITDATLACLARKPDDWAADTPDPPDRHYGEHGFVVGPDGNRVF